MGKKSEFNQNKDRALRLKLHDIMILLPRYTYDFLNEKADRNPNTALAYARDLLTFFQYLKEFCPETVEVEIKDIPLELIENLAYQDINEYQNYLDIKHPEVCGSKEHANGKHAIARKMCSLRGLYKFLCEHGYMAKNPTTGAVKQKIKLGEHEIVRMNKDEVNSYLKVIKDSDVKSTHQKKILQNMQKRDFAILNLLLFCGIRVSECVALDLDDLNFEENSLLIVRKGLKEQFVYFNEEVAQILKEYIETERPKYLTFTDEKALFLSTRKQRISVRSIQEMVKKYSKEIMINKSLSPHKMRSTYGTALYNKTGDIRLVADVLGHSDINTTAKYYAATEDERRKQASKVQIYE